MKVNRTREDVLLEAVENHMSYDETQELLRKHGESELYARDRRDSIIIWGLYHNKETTVINDLCISYHCLELKSENEVATGSSRITEKDSVILEQQ